MTNEKEPKHKLETGQLILHSKNCHIYKRQYELVKKLLSRKADFGSSLTKVKVSNDASLERN